MCLNDLPFTTYWIRALRNMGFVNIFSFYERITNFVEALILFGIEK
jgi:hypothetical protein